MDLLLVMMLTMASLVETNLLPTISKLTTILMTMLISVIQKTFFLFIV